MGAWGSGPFDNDEAMDFIDNLRELDPREVREAVRVAIRVPRTRIHYTLGAQAIAAAALVGLALHPEQSPPPDAADVLAGGGVPTDDNTRRTALAAVESVEQGDSEWAGLWSDSGSWTRAADATRTIRLQLSLDPRLTNIVVSGQDFLF